MALDFERLNRIGCWEWQLQSFDGHRLCLIGGADLVYSHIAELWVSGVAYVSCPTRLLHPTFRQPTEIERSSVRIIVDLSQSPLVVAIHAETESSSEPLPFLIVGEAVELVTGTVYHYERGDLQPGERIAPWVKRGGAS
jgi:hypothetical protein